MSSDLLIVINIHVMAVLSLWPLWFQVDWGECHQHDDFILTYLWVSMESLTQPSGVLPWWYKAEILSCPHIAILKSGERFKAKLFIYLTPSATQNKRIQRVIKMGLCSISMWKNTNVSHVVHWLWYDIWYNKLNKLGPLTRKAAAW